MIKNFFKFLDKEASQDDAILERLEKEDKVMKQFTYLGLSVINVLLMIFICGIAIYKAKYPLPAHSFALPCSTY